VRIDRTAPVIVLKPLLFGPAGKGRVEMALDTGATFVMIPWDVAEHLGYDPATSATRVAITTASTIEKAPLITLERIRVLDVEAKNVEVVVHDLPPKSRVDGLLGLSFLRNFNLHLLFRDGVLELRKP